MQGNQLMLGGLQHPIVPVFSSFNSRTEKLAQSVTSALCPSCCAGLLASCCYSAASLNRSSTCLHTVCHETILRAKEKTEFRLRYQRVNIFLGLQMYL